MSRLFTCSVGVDWCLSCCARVDSEHPNDNPGPYVWTIEASSNPSPLLRKTIQRSSLVGRGRWFWLNVDTDHQSAAFAGRPLTWFGPSGGVVGGALRSRFSSVLPAWSVTTRCVGRSCDGDDTPMVGPLVRRFRPTPSCPARLALPAVLPMRPWLTSDRGGPATRSTTLSGRCVEDSGAHSVAVRFARPEADDFS